MNLTQSGDPPLADSPTESSNAPRTPWLLFAGAAIGLALATFGLLEDLRDARTLPAESAAVVGDRTIRRVDYLRVLAGVEEDLRNPVDDSMRRRVLERMIDEELLVQRALDLGLAVVDRRVRGDLTSGLIDSVVSAADQSEPNERDVRTHFEENADFFTRPGRIRAETLYFSSRADEKRGAPATSRALTAREALLQGTSLEEVSRSFAEAQVSPPPNVLLPPSKLRDYVGPSVLKELHSIEVGAWTSPIESGGGIYLAHLLEREPARVPAIEEVESLVRQDLKRRRGDEALRAYLDSLRAETVVHINEEVFRAQIALE